MNRRNARYSERRPSTYQARPRNSKTTKSTLPRDEATMRPMQRALQSYRGRGSGDEDRSLVMVMVEDQEAEACNDARLAYLPPVTSSKL